MMSPKESESLVKDDLILINWNHSNNYFLAYFKYISEDKPNCIVIEIFMINRYDLWDKKEACVNIDFVEKLSV